MSRPLLASPAIVIGLDCITGLQTARILWRRGVPVIGVAQDRRHFACRTKSCRTVISAPTDGPELVERLLRLGPKLGRRGVLFPCTDAAVATVAGAREHLQPWFHVPLSDHETVMRLMDKVTFEPWALEHGFPIPRTVSLRSRGDAERAVQELSFPIVLKPAVKTRRWQSYTKAKVLEAADADTALRLYDEYAPRADALTAQEWVVGPESELYSCNAYFDADSRPLATFVARKLRQYPPRTGTSCLGEEVRNDVVLDTTVRLFTAARFHGLAYLEMKRDIRSGEYFIIEPNIGRPTGRSAIAEAGGVELLLTAYRDATGDALPTEREQRYTGVKWIYARHDLQTALHYWRRGELGLRDWWRSVSGVRTDAVWSRHDPIPFFGDLLSAAGKLRGGR